MKSHSADYDIEYADQLNVFFSDAKAPAPIAKPVSPEKPPVGQVASAPTGMPPPAHRLPRSEATRSGSERTRSRGAGRGEAEAADEDLGEGYSDVGAARSDSGRRKELLPKPDEKLAEKPAGTKYQLERVICEDNVVVQQRLADPAKPRHRHSWPEAPR